MNIPWDLNQPLEFLVKQIQDAVNYAAHANTPYTLKQIMNTVYTLIFNTGIFEDDWKKWRKRRPPQATKWPAFKMVFTEAYNVKSKNCRCISLWYHQRCAHQRKLVRRNNCSHI